MCILLRKLILLKSITKYIFHIFLLETDCVKTLNKGRSHNLTYLYLL